MRDDLEDLEREPLTWQPTDLGYGQFETIRKALEAEVLSPEMRAEALAALRHLYALSEVQGMKLLALNRFVIVDELGEPVTQAQYDAIRDRAFAQQETREILSDQVFATRLQKSIEQAQRGETLPLAEVQRRVDLDGDADQG